MTEGGTAAGGSSGHTADDPTGKRLAVLSLAAAGVVYGDIGTSPLYAIRESFHEEYGLEVVPANILGVLSCIFWALVLVISVKYLIFILRADNRGEGGILALAALVTPMQRGGKGKNWALIAMGLFGAALLYGDGMITPAISVLSAIEGLKVATPVFEPYIIPITVGILIGLFLFQSRGTEGVGKVFGPLTVLWFGTLAALGLYQLVREPTVVRALSPTYAASFFLDHGVRGFLVLGSVFLVVTGGEALYADMGHFGRRPIRLTWFGLVLPALLINYFGQGALLIRQPAAIENPFYRMGPDWALYPMVVIATIATVIASQAVISGSFSLAMQSVQFGYSPRLRIDHTSHEAIGQIYIPSVNWALMLACIALVIGFGSSSNLAAAYGVAVTTTMVITTILFYVLARRNWDWPRPLALAVSGFFMVIDLAFWGANMVKIPDGGWFPLLVAGIVFTVMTTWKRGREILGERLRKGSLPIEMFAEDIRQNPPTRVPGVGVFMYSDPAGTPPALLHNLKHNKVLHEQVVCLSVVTEEVPHVPPGERLSLSSHGEELYTIVLRYGFMDDVDVPAALAEPEGEIEVEPTTATFFLGRERIVASREVEGMAIWRERLFAVLARNARRATDFYRLPPNRVIELGAQIEM